MKELLINSEVCFLIKSVSVGFFLMAGYLAADSDLMIPGSKKIVLIDEFVHSCPYKKVVDASMRMWGYVQVLHDEHVSDQELPLMCDAIAGRMAHITKQMDALLDECKKGIVLLTDDVAYLVDLFYYIDREYQAIVRRRGEVVFVDMGPLYHVREQCLELIAM